MKELKNVLNGNEMRETEIKVTEMFNLKLFLLRILLELREQ